MKQRHTSQMHAHSKKSNTYDIWWMGYTTAQKWCQTREITWIFNSNVIVLSVNDVAIYNWRIHFWHANQSSNDFIYIRFHFVSFRIPLNVKSTYHQIYSVFGISFQTSRNLATIGQSFKIITYVTHKLIKTENNKTENYSIKCDTRLNQSISSSLYTKHVLCCASVCINDRAVDRWFG